MVDVPSTAQLPGEGSPNYPSSLVTALMVRNLRQYAPGCVGRTWTGFPDRGHSAAAAPPLPPNLGLTHGTCCVILSAPRSIGCTTLRREGVAVAAAKPRRKLIRQKDVADLFGVHPSTVARWIHAKDLPCVRIGGGVFVPVRAVEKLLTEAGIDTSDIAPEPAA